MATTDERSRKAEWLIKTLDLQLSKDQLVGQIPESELAKRAERDEARVQQIVSDTEKIKTLRKRLNDLPTPPESSKRQQELLSGPRESVEEALREEQFQTAEDQLTILARAHEQVLAELVRKKNIVAAKSKLADPKDASIKQQKRLETPRTALDSALSEDNFDEAETQLRLLGEVHQQVVLELVRKQKIVQQAGELSDPKDVSTKQQKRLAAPREAIASALNEDSFDEAETQLRLLGEVHQQVVLELVRKQKIVQQAGELSDPKGANDGQLARLAEPRRLLNEALAADEFDAAETQVGELRKTLVAVVGEIETERKAKSLANTIGIKIKAGLAQLEKLDSHQVDQKVLTALVFDSDAYAPMNPHQSVFRALSLKQPADLLGMEAFVGAQEAVIKAVDAAIQSASDELTMLVKKAEKQKQVVDAEFVKVNKQITLLDKPETLLEPFRQGWPRGKAKPELSWPPRIDVDYQSDYDAADKSRSDTEKRHVLLADWSVVLPLIQSVKKKLNDGVAAAAVEIKKQAVAEIKAHIDTERQKINEIEKNVDLALQALSDKKVKAPKLTEAEQALYDKLNKNTNVKVAERRKMLTEQCQRDRDTLDSLSGTMKEIAEREAVSETETDPAKRDGKEYVLIGEHEGGGDVYARLDDVLWTAKSEYEDSKGVYDTSMKKGVIGSGSTGSDGVKNESGLGGWVVKITIKIAKAKSLDNLDSPFVRTGDVIRDEGTNALYLNFTEWISRH